MFLASLDSEAEPPEVTTCRTPAYLLLTSYSPPRQQPDFSANFIGGTPAHGLKIRCVTKALIKQQKFEVI